MVSLVVMSVENIPFATGLDFFMNQVTFAFILLSIIVGAPVSFPHMNHVIAGAGETTPPSGITYQGI